MLSRRKNQNFYIFLCLVVIVTRTCPYASAEKPRLIPSTARNELIINEGTELKIECQSKQTRLHFSFPEYTFMSPRSSHVIVPPDNKNGTWTFIRRKAVSLDTGWYACAAEDVKIENHFKNLNHTQEDIAWIYVYVSSSELFADRYYTFPKTIIILAGSPGIVPCRPTSPDLVVELWKNFRIADSDEQDSFDSKIGFIVKPPSPEDPRSIFQCKINGTEDEYFLFYSNATGRKPKINVIGDELVLREGEELRIECYGETNIQFGFLSNHDINNYWIRSSEDVIISDGKGKATLQKREVVLGDMGWYGCAEVGIDLHTSPFYMDYTRQEINWIYVYVETEERQLLPHNSLVAVSARSISILVPCRPTSPYVNVSLEFESKILALDENVQFHPRLGFTVRRRPHRVIFDYKCIIHGDNTENQIEFEQFIESGEKPAIYLGDSILLTGEDLLVNCSCFSQILISLDWNTPPTVSKNRIELKRTWLFIDHIMNSTLFNISLTIRNVTMNDIGEYSCTSRSAEREEKSDPVNIDIYDRHSINQVIIGNSDAANTFVGQLGQSVKWMLNYNDSFNLPENIDWFNPLQNSIRLAVKLNTTKYSLWSRGKTLMVLGIHDLTFKDAGLYTVYDPKDYVTRVRVTLLIQTPPSIFILNDLDPYFVFSGYVFRIHARITASPKPNVTWTFTTDPNFSSHKDSSLMILKDHNEVFVDNYIWTSELTMNTSISGILNCTACNFLNCSWDSKRIPVSRLVGKGHNMNLRSMIIATVAIFICVPTVCLVIRKRHAKNLKHRIKQDILKRFDGGALDYLDPNLDVADQAEVLPYDENWEYPRNMLQFGKILGSGAFGIVRKAEAKSIRPGEPFTTVAVKMVRATSALHHMMALSRELKVLVHLGQHQNIVNLLGACTKNISFGELFVIVEFCRFGNLKDYLSRRRADFIDKVDPITGEINVSDLNIDNASSNDEGASVDCDIPMAEDSSHGENSLGVKAERVPCEAFVEPRLRSKYKGDYADGALKPIQTGDLLCWAWQVSRGMRYLGVRKVVHGDLAARNILLADNNVIKICDFGLAKALYNDDYYNKEDEDPLPFRWMSIEAIKDRRFSIESDIWSFGIVLWEFFTLAKSPYSDIHPRYLYQKLLDGYRMDKPKFAPKNIYRIMMNCWEAEPVKRPSFKLIETLIHESLEDSMKAYYLDSSNQYCSYVLCGRKDYLTMDLSQKETVSFAVEQELVQLGNVVMDNSSLSQE